MKELRYFCGLFVICTTRTFYQIRYQLHTWCPNSIHVRLLGNSLLIVTNSFFLKKKMCNTIFMRAPYALIRSICARNPSVNHATIKLFIARKHRCWHLRAEPSAKKIKRSIYYLMRNVLVRSQNKLTTETCNCLSVSTF